jgi:hypothetical protein
MTGDGTRSYSTELVGFWSRCRFLALSNQGWPRVSRFPFPPRFWEHGALRMPGACRDEAVVLAGVGWTAAELGPHLQQTGVICSIKAPTSRKRDPAPSPFACQPSELQLDTSLLSVRQAETCLQQYSNDTNRV